MPPSNDEGRLLEEPAPHVNYTTTADSTASSCWICGRALHAEVSVRLGIGPKCWADRTGGAA